MSKPIFKIQAVSVYISTTLVLLLLGIMGIMFIGGHSLSGKIKESFRITAIIDRNAQESDILELKKKIDRMEYVLESRYISKEQILEDARKSLKTDPMELLSENPYKAEIELTLKQEYSNNEFMSKVETELCKNSLVEKVEYYKDHINTVNTNIRKAGIALLALLVMLTIISWSLIGNLVRLSIYSKRFLLHTMKLVGATWGFIRHPFIVSNMVIGLVSGILANLILGTGLFLIQQKEPGLINLLPTESLLIVAGGITLFGIIICTLCAYVSVNRFLRMRSNDLYFI